MRAFGALLGIALFVGTVAGPARGYESGPADDGATILGIVRIAGDAPGLKSHEVFKHREWCGATVPNESLVLGPGQGVRYAVVTIEGITRGKAVERDAVNVLDNRRCRFVPHVLTASVGQWLLLTNSDPILHNADAFNLDERRALFNVALPPHRQVRQPLARPGRIRITCEVRHTWMEAFVVVSDHPYATVTDAAGEYELRDVPPGTYRLRVWHELLGALERSVTLAKGDKHEENFVFSAKK